MTNGEKIKELFPSFDVEDKTEYFGRLRNLDDHFIKADIDWWNAEYKEPTTKKCTTCVYRETDGKPHEMCKSCVCSDRYREDSTTKNDLGVDCISRADAIKGLGEQPYVWTDSDFEIQQLADWKTHKEMLENLPSVTPQEPRWIPVSERLPNVGYQVLVTRYYNGCRYMDISTYQDNEVWMSNSDEYNKPNKHRVLAWMSLPIAYREVEK